mmetsp:Transcript_11108/g.26104  ORF Transcript_11108/g.26104 Transcript_11108/m.26104 type:complete len:228 (-) Transcript_11108:539-1222(-)
MLSAITCSKSAPSHGARNGEEHFAPITSTEKDTMVLEAATNSWITATDTASTSSGEGSTERVPFSWYLSSITNTGLLIERTPKERSLGSTSSSPKKFSYSPSEVLTSVAADMPRCTSSSMAELERRDMFGTSSLSPCDPPTDGARSAPSLTSALWELLKLPWLGATLVRLPSCPVTDPRRDMRGCEASEWCEGTRESTFSSPSSPSFSSSSVSRISISPSLGRTGRW